MCVNIDSMSYKTFTIFYSSKVLVMTFFRVSILR